MHPILRPLSSPQKFLRNSTNILPHLVYCSKSNGNDSEKGNNNKNNNKSCDENEVVDKELERLLEDVPTNCCMSGCANCVWVQYAEKLLEHLDEEGGMVAVRQIEKHVDDPNMKAFLMHEFRMRKIIK